VAGWVSHHVIFAPRQFSTQPTHPLLARAEHFRRGRKFEFFQARFPLVWQDDRWCLLAANLKQHTDLPPTLKEDIIRIPLHRSIQLVFFSQSDTYQISQCGSEELNSAQNIGGLADFFLPRNNTIYFYW